MVHVALSDHTVERLQQMAVKRHVAVKDVLEEAVEFYLIHAPEDYYPRFV